MPLGTLRTTSGVPQALVTAWFGVHGAWSAHFDNVQKCTLGVDAPELWSERTFVALWASAINASYPAAGAALVERPVPKPANKSGSGLLDLWMSIDGLTPPFDYAVEAKPLHVHGLNAQASAAAIFDLAKQELAACRSVGGGGFCCVHAGLSAGIIGMSTSLGTPSAQQLNAFEQDLWNALQALVTAQANPNLEAVLVSKAFVPGAFNPWQGHAPFGAYAFLLCEDAP